MWRRVSSILLLGIFLSFSSSAQNTYDGHLTQAKSLITQQKYGDAVKVAEKAIAINGQRWEAYVIAAKGYSSQKLYDDAIGMLQVALAHAPDDKKPLARDAIAECRKEQNQGSGSTPGTQASNAATALPTASTPTQAEIVLWKSIEDSGNPDDLKAYLNAYPNGAFVPLARGRLASYLQKQETDRWKQIEGSEDPDDFQSYLDSYPSGAYSTLAQSRLASELQKQGSESPFDLANHYYKKLEFHLAARMFQNACDGGDARGCTHLGQMYESGQGVAKDVNRAEQLYLKACDGGDTRGCTNLGFMYASGQEVPMDVNRAAQLYQTACDKGDDVGCKNLSALKKRRSP